MLAFLTATPMNYCKNEHQHTNEALMENSHIQIGNNWYQIGILYNFCNEAIRLFDQYQHPCMHVMIQLGEVRIWTSPGDQ